MLPLMSSRISSAVFALPVRVLHAGAGRYQDQSEKSRQVRDTKLGPSESEKVRNALLALNAMLPDLKRAFGRKDQVDPVRHLIGTASGWGGNPDNEAIYLNVTPPRNDGSTVYELSVKDVPVDGSWSISLYNADGYFVRNQYEDYSLNNFTARKSADGSIAVQFGGCDGKIPNCLPTIPSWNYMVRLYRPRAEILSGKWKFPEAQPVVDVERGH
jgi:hypothetical protein